MCVRVLTCVEILVEVQQVSLPLAAVLLPRHPTVLCHATQHGRPAETCDEEEDVGTGVMCVCLCVELIRTSGDEPNINQNFSFALVW